MPAIAGDVMGLKFVTFYPANAGTGVPTHNATILLYRTGTGEPLAAMDGRLITEMRTAAVSAAVTKYLAAPQSRVLALLGSGVQARSHLQALACVRDFSEIRVWSRTAEHARRFASEHGIVAVDSPEAAVRGADVRGHGDGGARTDPARSVAQTGRSRQRGRIVATGVARARRRGDGRGRGG